MSETLDYLRTFVAFPVGLRRFLRGGPLTLAEAQRIVRKRMQQRDANFLGIVERDIYGHPRSPYLALLRHVGCELADVRALVRQHGLEGALRELRQAGVYVSFEEFKGRKPITRPGLTLPVTPEDFDNPSGRSVFSHESGGSSGAASRAGVHLGQIAARAPAQMVAYAAHDLLEAPIMLWRGMLPDFTLGQILMFAFSGRTPQRWFTPVGWRASKHWFKYGLASYYMLAWMRLNGLRVPAPRHAGVEQALAVAQAMAEALKTHGACLLRTQVSRALRACNAALQAGIDLTGATVQGGSEPPTPAKVSRIQESGARFVPNYSITGAGQVAYGCARPLDGSDVHLYKDALALITYPHEVEGFGVTVPALHLTGLLAVGAKVLLNLQMDDYGIVEERNCGCELETYGYTTHIRDIRSYSKLTGEGVTLIGTDMTRILEEVLPARFGGGPFDYQLMEHEDEQGYTRLALIVHPRVQIADEQAVIAAVLDALRQTSPMADAARTLWQAANTLQIRRVEPVWTRRGKFLPLHIERRLNNSEPPG